MNTQKRWLNHILITRLLFSFLAALLASSNVSQARAASLLKPQNEKSLSKSIGQVLKDHEQEQRNLEKSHSDIIDDFFSLTLQGEKAQNFEGDFDNKETTLNINEKKLAENHQRIEFLNSFLTASDKAHGDIREDAIKILKNMAERQSLISTNELGSESNLTKFELYFSLAARDCLEPNEDFAQFLTDYLKATASTDSNSTASIQYPRSPKEFCKTRLYWNEKR